VPSDIVTCESASPVHFGPTRPSPFEPWQLAHPEADESSCPARASADSSIEAELLLEEHEVKKKPTEASNTEVDNKLINLNFEDMFKQYRSTQVEFATVVLKIW
jgi:hypothetical protein